MGKPAFCIVPPDKTQTEKIAKVLEFFDTATIGIVLSRQYITKALIKLHGQGRMQKLRVFR